MVLKTTKENILAKESDIGVLEDQKGMY